MRVLFVRHGESEANVLKVFSNRGWKHPLTESGRRQAGELAGTLARFLVARIHTSPLQRAVETAKILGVALDAPVEVEPALVEYDVGTYEGRGDDAGWAAQAAIEQLWVAGDLDARMPEGESCNDIRSRVNAFLSSLIRIQGMTNTTLVLIGHGGTYRLALPHVLSNISEAFARENHLGNCSFVEAHLQDGRLICTSWAGKSI